MIEVYSERALKEIIERKNAEKQLKKSEKRWVDSFNSLDDIMLITDKDCIIENINDIGLKLFGKTIDEVRGKKCYQIIHNLNTHVENCPFQTALKTGKAESVDIYDKTFDKYFNVKSSPIFNKRDEVVGHVDLIRDITERKKAEDEIEKNNILLRGILENTHMMVVYLDSKFDFIFVNKAYADTCKRPQDFFPGKNHFDLYPSEEVEAIFQNVVDTGKPFFVEGRPFEFPDQPKRGITYWDWSLIPIKDPQSEVVELVFTLAEVTSRVKAESAEKKYLENIENLARFPSENPNPVLRIGKDGVILYANESAKSLLTEWKCEVGQSAPDSWSQKASKSFDSDSSLRFEVEHLKHIFSFEMFPVTDAGYVNAYGRDITERKKADNIIRQQNVFLENTIESLTHPFYVINADDYTIQMANSASGLGDRLKESTCYELTHKKEAPCVGEHICPLEEVKKTKKPVIVEHIHYGLDGHAMNVEVHGYPIFDAQGNIVQMIEYTLDITERKKAQAELQKARDTLEIEVKKRTKELQDANIRLKELGDLKSTFISSMSHELRTPLNSIIGFTGIMLQGMAGELTEEQSRQLSIVKKSGEHLLALISDVIDVSKIEANHLELDIKEFDFSDMMRDVQDSFKVAIDEKGLKLVLKVPEKLMVESDERRMKQVVMNFVSNAIKFTDEGMIEIRAVERDGNVEVSVKDTGIGMKKEDMTILFKQFSRIPVKGRMVEKGTGLGLYLSKKLSDFLGGEVKVESTYGVGSKFTVIFPLIYDKAMR